jgi:hypothetical protein
LTSSQRPITYDSSKLVGIGWKPQVSLANGLEQLVMGEFAQPTVAAELPPEPELARSGAR